MSNPDYALGLSQMVGLTGAALEAKIAEVYQFNVPLTDVEKQLFGYLNFDYVENNPDTSGDSYVGTYFPDATAFSPRIDNTVPSDKTHQVLLYDSQGVPLISSLGTPLTLSNINFTLNAINTKLTSIT